MQSSSSAVETHIKNFSDEECKSLSDYEKVRCLSLKRNYECMKSVGSDPNALPFMGPKKNVSGKTKEFVETKESGKKKRNAKTVAKDNDGPKSPGKKASGSIPLKSVSVRTGLVNRRSENQKKQYYLRQSKGVFPDMQCISRYPKRTTSQKCFTEDEDLVIELSDEDLVIELGDEDLGAFPDVQHIGRYPKRTTSQKCYTEDGDLVCDICHISFTSESALERHNKWHPDMSRKGCYKCDLCPYSTSARKDLRYHLQTHTG